MSGTNLYHLLKCRTKIFLPRYKRKQDILLQFFYIFHFLTSFAICYVNLLVLILFIELSQTIANLGPDHLELNILKIIGKIFLVIYNLLFLKIVDFLLVICQNNKQKIDYLTRNKITVDIEDQGPSS